VTISPLGDTRVVDLWVGIPRPHRTKLLTDGEARSVKVEPPVAGVLAIRVLHQHEPGESEQEADAAELTAHSSRRAMAAVKEQLAADWSRMAPTPRRRRALPTGPAEPSRSLGSGGEKGYPTEVEVAMMRCPGVRQSAVVGIPDERYGEAVCAVVLTDGAPKTASGKVDDVASRRLAVTEGVLA
jgi:hypothetical protein